MDVQSFKNFVQFGKRVWKDSWTWEEIYLALCRERGCGEGFLVDASEVRHPLAAGALSNQGRSEGWDYMFPASEGGGLYIVAQEGRYLAFLDLKTISRNEFDGSGSASFCGASGMGGASFPRPRLWKMSMAALFLGLGIAFAV